MINCELRNGRKCFLEGYTPLAPHSDESSERRLQGSLRCHFYSQMSHSIKTSSPSKNVNRILFKANESRLTSASLQEQK
jgi:hypothetical protein